MNKSKLAKLLGISRPTLDKNIKSKNDSYIKAAFEAQLSGEYDFTCIKLSSLHNLVPPKEIESIMEFLADNQFLNEEGKKFVMRYWNLFIKE